jgi:beta-galactosidase
MMWPTTCWLLLLFWSITPAFGDRPDSQRSKHNFNSGWKVVVGDPASAQEPKFDDSKWKRVSTPHAWNEDDAFRKDISELSTGIAWYRKQFRLPKGSNERKVFLEFEGIRHGGEFYLNGKHIGNSENGIMAFGLDITNYIVDGQNTLAARIDNSWDYHEKKSKSTFQWNNKNFYANYGGINKNVYLHITDKLHQTLPLYSNLQTIGPSIYAGNFDIMGRSATVTAETQVRNEYPTAKTFLYRAVITDINGTITRNLPCKEYTLKSNQTLVIRTSDIVSNLHFWSWGYGYLYNVHTILEVNRTPVDVVTTRTGFRKTDFAHGAFLLNDRALHLTGYAQRTTNEWPVLGSAVPAWLSQLSAAKMLESNANLVRWMHVTPWKQDVGACDRVGLLQAMPAGDSERDMDGRRWEQRMEGTRACRRRTCG